ncbi:MAG: hypothetical protein M1818_004122 [Claussenomyces sp. TS43310]|nr:MAG: hypothetical protein M1818_004122 [Claussenomyces sp. TS43310]
MGKATVGPGVYSATYSNIPVYEFQFGQDLKEHVMRRRHDDWINATHILKAAGFDKPARTRILEREVQKDVHEKVQGGYGKYQGTWVPLEAGQALAHRNLVYEKIRTIFEFVPGNESPPPAPKHTTNKPKVPKKPAVPKFHSMPTSNRLSHDSYDNISAQLNDDDELPDDTTVASASFMDEDDRYDVSQHSTGHRKRKREQDIPLTSISDQNHIAYSDELLDYFMLSQDNEIANRPEPPPNFQPNWVIDSEGHTAMHWACAMGDVEVIKQLKRFSADMSCQNHRGETPLMRAVLFTNCYDKQTMPRVLQEVLGTIDAVDFNGYTVIHHAAAMTAHKVKLQCARYYLDVILNKLIETNEQAEIRDFLDIQDAVGNTACHIAASNRARKCVRALMGRGASTDMPNNEGVTAQELIQELNSTRRERNLAASSSPFAPDSQRRISFQEPILDGISRHTVPHHSEAAMTVESKVTPLILDKFQDLARSFDEELIDRDNSEKEAKRILHSTHIELAQIREQMEALLTQEEDDGTRARELDELARAKQNILSLVEQQQQLRLAAALQQHEESLVNGHGAPNDGDGVEPKLDLLQLLEAQQHKRAALVDEYANALSLAGMGEKGDVYRRLTGRCLGLPDDQVDAQLDGLLTILEEERIEAEARGSIDPVLIDGVGA